MSKAIDITTIDDPLLIDGTLIIRNEITPDLTTITTIKLNPSDGTHAIVATGRAKLNPTDIYDMIVGNGIAFGRALEKLGHKYSKYWEGQSETPAQRKSRLRRNHSAQVVVDAVTTWQRINENALRASKKALEGEKKVNVAPSATTDKKVPSV